MGVCTLLLAGCNGKPAASEPTNAPAESGTAANTVVGAALDLPLPAVPDSLTKPTDRANYALLHFWDRLDWADTARTHNGDYLEQNFANFLSLFPLADQAGRTAAASRLLANAEADTVAFNRITTLADKYLYDPQSPFYSDTHYIAFLEALLCSSSVDSTQATIYAYRREVATKNLPGTCAADFKLLTRNGRRSSLSTMVAQQELTLLVFYDPECTQCAEILQQIDENYLINSLVDQGLLSILAVYAEGKCDVWEKTKQTLPAAWTVAMDIDHIQDEELYVLRAMPTLFLLQSDLTVLLKDPPLDALLLYLAQLNS